MLYLVIGLYNDLINTEVFMKNIFRAALSSLMMNDEEREQKQPLMIGEKFLGYNTSWYFLHVKMRYHLPSSLMGFPETDSLRQGSEKRDQNGGRELESKSFDDS